MILSGSSTRKNNCLAGKMIIYRVFGTRLGLLALRTQAWFHVWLARRGTTLARSELRQLDAELAALSGDEVLGCDIDRMRIAVVHILTLLGETF